MESLAELFDRDPLSYTREDYDIIVKRLREARAQFQLGVKQAGNMKAKKKPVGSVLDLKLDDLDI